MLLPPHGRSAIKLLSCLAVAASVACGSTSDPVTPDPDPDPPPTLVPTSISISAGNQQEAEPGKPVATVPAVLVRSANGTAVPNVAVTFTVDSGGGSIANTTATTNASGVASPGVWTLGAQEGPQVLSAKAGTLAPVKIRAVARIPTTVVNTGTVSPNGGTLTVSLPGSPLHGATLQIGNGALGGAATITLLASSTAGLTIPNGMQAVSPGLGIASSAGALGESALITLPATPAPGKVLMIAVGNPATGAITLLPTASSTGTSITALLPALDSRVVPAAVAGAMQGRVHGTRDEEPGSITFLIAINEELLQGDFDSDFRPGVDDWDFEPMSIAKLPFLKANAADGLLGEYVVNTDGMVSTAIWYHVHRKKAAGGPKLRGSTQEAPGEPLSSRSGIRWTALADGDVPSFNQTGSMAVRKWADAITEDHKRFAWLQFLSIKGLLLQTFKRPVPVVLLSVEDPDEFNVEAYPLGIAYRTEGNTVYITTPLEAGREIAVKFSEEGGMEPFDLRLKNGRLINIKAITGVHYVNVIDDAKLASQWARVANGTIGDAEGWPTPELHWEKDKLDTAKVYLLDELQHWWECAQCPDLVPRPDQLPATASHVQRFQFARFTGNQIGALTASTSSSLRFSATDVFEGEEDARRIGAVLWHPLVRDVELGYGVGWLDWITTTYRKLKLEPSVEKITLSKDTTVTITVTPSHAPPAGTTFSWVLRTEEVRDSVATTVPTHTRELRSGTEGKLLIMAHEATTRRIIARDSVDVKGDAVPYWRILTLENEDDAFEEYNGNETFRAMYNLVQAPLSGLLGIIELPGGGTEVAIRVRDAGIWSEDMSCCPPPVTGSERKLVLGRMPAETKQFGGAFASWRTVSWSQSTDNLSTGTMTARHGEGSHIYQGQVGPVVGWRLIEVVREGRNLRGVITMSTWSIDPQDPVDEEHVQRFPFTAIRVR